MKQTLFNYALVIASALCLSGCEKYEQVQIKEKYCNTPFEARIYLIEIKGHDYIVLYGSHKGGITHSESCPCKKEDKDESNW